MGEEPAMAADEPGSFLPSLPSQPFVMPEAAPSSVSERTPSPAPDSGGLPAGQAGCAFTLRPILFAYMCGTMAMMAFVSIVGSLSRQLGLAPWQAGMSVTVSGVLWMLMSPVWGRRSDRLGRRAVMLTGFAGFFVSYCAMSGWLVAAMRVPMSVGLVFAGLVLTRGAIGGFYAAAPTASQALIADNLPPERRVAAMASLGAANGAGLVLGPALAAQLTHFGLEAPLYLTALLPALGLAVLWKFLPATPPVGARPGQSPRLLDPRLRRPMVAAFTALFTVAVGQIVVGFFAIDRLGMTPGEGAQAAGMALTTVGVALIITQMVVRRVMLPPGRMICIGMTTAGIGFGSVLLATGVPTLMLSYFVAAAGMGFVFPAFTAMAANAVQPHEQGAAAGSVGAAQGLGNVLGPLAGALLYEISPTVPYALAAVLLLGVAVWVGRTGKPNREGRG